MVKIKGGFDKTLFSPVYFTNKLIRIFFTQFTTICFIATLFLRRKLFYYNLTSCSYLPGDHCRNPLQCHQPNNNHRPYYHHFNMTPTRLLLLPQEKRILFVPVKVCVFDLKRTLLLGSVPPLPRPGELSSFRSSRTI